MSVVIGWARRVGSARWHGFGLADAGAALVLTLLGQFEVWGHPSIGPQLPIALLVFSMTAALAWRRIWPLRTAFLVAGDLLVLGVVWGVPALIVTPSVVAIVACYSCAAHLSLRPAAVESRPSPPPPQL